MTLERRNFALSDFGLESEVELQKWSQINEAWGKDVITYFRRSGTAPSDFGLSSEEDLQYWSEVNEAWGKDVILYFRRNGMARSDFGLSSEGEDLQEDLQYWSEVNEAWRNDVITYFRRNGTGHRDFGLSSEGDLQYWSEVNEAWSKLQGQNSRGAPWFERKGVAPEDFGLQSNIELEEWAVVNDEWCRYQPLGCEDKTNRNNSMDHGEHVDDQNLDRKCDICSDEVSAKNNLIIFCDRCDTAVHQHCYGVPKVPSGDWFCDPCTFYMEGGGSVKDKAILAKCALCHQKGGALKATACGQWAHLICVLYIPELSFVLPGSTAANSASGMRCCVSKTLTVGSLQDLDATRKEYVCAFCSLSGGVRMCEMAGCESAVHITCAMNAKLVFEDHEDSGGSHHNWYVQVFIRSFFLLCLSVKYISPALKGFV